MRNFLVILMTIVAAVACGPVGGFCLAAIPDQSLDALSAAATHVLAGKVVRVYTSTEQTSLDWETVYCIAEIEVSRQDKGSAVGRLAYVRYELKEYTGTGPAPPGDYGQRRPPTAGDSVLAFVKQAKDGGLDVLAPNGFRPVK